MRPRVGRALRRGSDPLPLVQVARLVAQASGLPEEDVTLVLWLSLAAGSWISVEIPMPDEASCRKAVAAYRVSPKPHERVAYCKPL